VGTRQTGDALNLGVLAYLCNGNARYSVPLNEEYE
jgi:hypothetical protein